MFLTMYIVESDLTVKKRPSSFFSSLDQAEYDWERGYVAPGDDARMTVYEDTNLNKAIQVYPTYKELSEKELMELKLKAN